MPESEPVSVKEKLPEHVPHAGAVDAPAETRQSPLVPALVPAIRRPSNSRSSLTNKSPVPEAVVAVAEPTVAFAPKVTVPFKVRAVDVDAPLPVTEDSVSASDAEEDEIVIVDPDWAIEAEPEAFRVTAPVRSFTLVMTAVESRLTTGFWSPVTAIPVPAETV